MNLIRGILDMKSAKVTEQDIDKYFIKKLNLTQPHVALDKPISMLGIDSIAGIELLNELESKYQIIISPEMFFSGLTLGEVRDLILREKMGKMDVLHTCKLSSYQQQLCKTMDLNDCAESQLLDIKINGYFDYSYLLQSLKNLQNRHDILKATLRKAKDNYRLVIHPNLEPALTYKDLCHSEFTYIDYMDMIHDVCLIAQEKPLFHSWVIQLDAHDYHIVFLFHPLLCDEIMVNTYIMHLLDEYNHVSQGDKLQCQPGIHTFEGYLDYQKEHYVSTMDNLMPYYDKYDCSDFSQEILLKKPVTHHLIDVPQELTDELLNLCDAKQISIDAVMLLALVNVHHQFYADKQYPLLINNSIMPEGSMGLLLNPYPVTDLMIQPEINNYALQQSHKIVELFHHHQLESAEVFFAGLNKKTQLQKGFLYTNVPVCLYESFARLGDAKISSITKSSRNLLELYCHAHERDKLCLGIFYQPVFFTNDHVEDFIINYKKALADLCAIPSCYSERK
jgi:acyl carrier protein